MLECGRSEQFAVTSERSWLSGLPKPDDESAHANANDPYTRESWDVLWLGHCGLQATAGTFNISYDDPHALPWDHLGCPLHNCFAELQRDQSRQQISPNVVPTCTYAYALTGEHAKTVLARVSKERCQSFDMCVYYHCQKGLQRCTSPMPELFHHHKIIGQKHLGGPVAHATGEKQGLEWWQDKHKYTYNVQWGARCNAGQAGEKLETGCRCLPAQFDDVWRSKGHRGESRNMQIWLQHGDVSSTLLVQI